MVTGRTFHAEILQTFGANVQNLVATASWCPEFVHPWLIELHSTDVKVSRFSYEWRTLIVNTRMA